MTSDLQRNEGYSAAFYELAEMMGISAQPISPKQVWEDQMRPAIQKALTAETAAYVAAVRLAESLHHIHYGPITTWRPMPTVEGVISQIDNLTAGLNRAARSQTDILADLSSYVGAGMGDDATSAEEYGKRIRWGIDHLASSYRSRAAQIVEDCSKRPSTTWGNVRRAILDDTALSLALGESK